MCPLHQLHTSLPSGTFALGEGAWVSPNHSRPGVVVGRLDILDPHRDEDDFQDEGVAEFEEHHCVVLVPEWWMCENCGASFKRDASMGDEPEEAIIQGGGACVAYVPDDENASD